MAKRSRKKAPAKKEAPSILKDGRLKGIVGVFLIFTILFLFTSMFSYLGTWKQDQDKVFNATDYVSFVFDKDIKVDNAAGNLGAITAHNIVFKGFGLASYLFLVFIIIFIINLLRKKEFTSTLKFLFYTAISVLLLSPLLAYFFNSGVIGNGQQFQYGGSFGNTIVSLLTGAFGSGGALAINIALAIALIILLFNPIIKLPFWSKLFQKRNIIPLQDEAEIKAAKIAEPEVIVQEPTPEPILEIDESISPEIVLEEKSEPAVSNPFDQLTLVEKEEPAQAEEPPAIQGTEIELDTETPVKKAEQKTDELELEVQAIKEEEKIPNDIKLATDELYDPSLDLRDYKFPTIDLLENRVNTGMNIDKDELENNKNQIINTLKSFKIDIQKISATIGPTVTLYEIVPAEGVRISKIRNLEDDIALNLAALGIRIIAPIPGKGTIGIEVPNKNKQIVNMRTLLASEKFKNTDAALPIAIGKTISNDNYIVDLAKMPHLLMAGATGQGKSVGINALLVSLLYKKHPSQLKFVLVDPKKVELSVYRLIEKHFLAKLPDEEEAIITDTKKVVNTINALCIEMDERYELLKNAGARNLAEYNAKFIKRKLNPEKGHKYLPYIVLVIDEFADLIMTAGKEIETPIARLAQLARAIGIHLIVATQRPSVNVITGTIKANFPARMAFKVSSKIDSRTILDTGGADQLIGRGDMLISNGGELVRLQCAFVDTPEVEAIVEFIGQQRGYPIAHELPEYVGAEGDTGSNGQQDVSSFDKMFKEAAALVVTSESGSTSMLQRRFNLGYNRAGRIMDQLEAVGIVGPSRGSKAREVMVKTEAELMEVLQELNIQ